MGPRFLIDTNILIYLSKGEFPGSIDDQWLLRLFKDSFQISIITKIEFLGWRKHTVDTFKTAQNLVKNALIHGLNESIADKTIHVRRKHKIRLPDAVIAATCLVQSLTLVTTNDKDFIGIKGLKVLNPIT